MGLIGTLLIHLKAQTGQFEQGMARSRQQMREFGKEASLGASMSNAFFNQGGRVVKGLVSISLATRLATAGLAAVRKDYTKLEEVIRSIPFVGEGWDLGEQLQQLTSFGKIAAQEMSGFLGGQDIDAFVKKLNTQRESEQAVTTEEKNRIKVMQQMRDNLQEITDIRVKYPGIDDSKIREAIEAVVQLRNVQLDAPVRSITRALGEQFAIAGKTANQIKEYELRQAGASEAVIEGARAIMAETDAIKRQANALKDYEDKIKELRDELLRERGASDYEMWKRANPDATKEQQNFVKGLYDSLDAEKKRKEQLAESARMWMDTRTPLEKHALDLAHIQDLYKQGTIDADTYRRAVKKLFDEINNDTFSGYGMALPRYMSIGYYQNRNANAAWEGANQMAGAYSRAGITGGSDTGKLEKLMESNNNLLRELVRGGGLN